LQSLSFSLIVTPMRIKLSQISHAEVFYNIKDDTCEVKMDLSREEAEDLIKVLQMKLEEEDEATR
jgi:hypothetical protein